jgi:hypothetical protein
VRARWPRGGRSGARTLGEAFARPQRLGSAKPTGHGHGSQQPYDSAQPHQASPSSRRSAIPAATLPPRRAAGQPIRTATPRLAGPHVGHPMWGPSRWRTIPLLPSMAVAPRTAAASATPFLGQDMGNGSAIVWIHRLPTVVLPDRTDLRFSRLTTGSQNHRTKEPTASRSAARRTPNACCSSRRGRHQTLEINGEEASASGTSSSGRPRDPARECSRKELRVSAPSGGCWLCRIANERPLPLSARPLSSFRRVASRDRFGDKAHTPAHADPGRADDRSRMTAGVGTRSKPEPGLLLRLSGAWRC